jgi:hypothetical protein
LLVEEHEHPGGGSEPRALDKAFGGVDWNAFEASWKAHML